MNKDRIAGSRKRSRARSKTIGKTTGDAKLEIGKADKVEGKIKRCRRSQGRAEEIGQPLG